MKEKIIFLFAFAMLFLAVAPAFAEEGSACNENEKCDGVITNGACIGECKPVDENVCSLLSFSIGCLVEKTISGWADKGKNFVNNMFVSLLGFDLYTAPGDFAVKAKGNEKLWEFSYEFSFLLATLMFILTTISYFKETLKDNSNVEIVESLKNQLFRLVFMFIFLAGSVAIVSMILEWFHILNMDILNSLNFNIGQDIVSLLFASMVVLIPIMILSFGFALAVFVMIFVSFFIVASLRILVLYILLSLIPIAIVLYFFDATKKIGATIMRLTFSNLIILTIWITIFAVAGDIGSGSVGGGASIQGFFILAAFLINTMLYFKVNSFFASLATETRGEVQRIVEKVTTKERMTIIKEKAFGKSLPKGQEPLTHWR